ncbi:hypothetical protein ACWD4K_01005 [Streptomyces gelaticus]
MLVVPEQERQVTLGRIRAFLAGRPETADGEFTLPMLTGVLRVRRLKKPSTVELPSGAGRASAVRFKSFTNNGRSPVRHSEESARLRLCKDSQARRRRASLRCP